MYGCCVLASWLRCGGYTGWLALLAVDAVFLSVLKNIIDPALLCQRASRLEQVVEQLPPLPR